MAGLELCERERGGADGGRVRGAANGYVNEPQPGVGRGDRHFRRAGLAGFLPVWAVADDEDDAGTRQPSERLWAKLVRHQGLGIQGRIGAGHREVPFAAKAGLGMALTAGLERIGGPSNSMTLRRAGRIGPRRTKTIATPHGFTLYDALRHQPPGPPMRLRSVVSLLTLSLAVAAGPLAAAQDLDGPVITASDENETPEARRVREAIAYATPLPRGAPEQDYPLIAWCAALVEGHVALGQTLTTADDLDREIMRLGRLEATDFREALRIGSRGQTAETRTASEAAAAEASAKWAPFMALADERARSEAFGLFFGLPGRCEHAARRVRENITTPPVTLDAAGLDEVGVPVAP